MHRTITVTATGALTAAIAMAATISVSTAAEFYANRTLTLVVSAGAGGGYGAVSQIVGRHLPNHIPGKPTMVSQYMGKAGGLVAANYIANAAPQDGTYIGLLRNATAFGQIMKLKGIKYDVTKLHWIGSTGPVINVLAIRKTTKSATLEGMKKQAAILGGTGRLGTLYTFPTAMHKILGYKSKIVLGYKGTRDVRGALDRKEVDGFVQPWPNWKRSHFHKQGLVNYVVQFGYERLPDLPNVPTLIELGRNAEQIQMLKLISIPSVLGRNFATPPSVPKARVALLRKAFDATMKDPAFIADMKKRGRMYDPKTGAELVKLMAEVLATPKALVNQVRGYLGYL
jgi:tripartite-type tricarboxylate transporter receptor subunit TctC